MGSPPRWESVRKFEAAMTAIYYEMLNVIQPPWASNRQEFLTGIPKNMTNMRTSWQLAQHLLLKWTLEGPASALGKEVLDELEKSCDGLGYKFAGAVGLPMSG